MLSSIFKLTKDTELPLQEAVKLATLNPAKAVNIDDKYGSIAVGKQANIIVVEPSNKQHHVVMVLIDGIKRAEYNY